jgi:hypothetical protein
VTARPKVALSQDFLLTISKLPPAVHSKVLKWTVQFQTHPASPGINYEKINRAIDPNLKSVRIDQDYRGIVFKPKRATYIFSSTLITMMPPTGGRLIVK